MADVNPGVAVLVRIDDRLENLSWRIEDAKRTYIAKVRDLEAGAAELSKEAESFAKTGAHSHYHRDKLPSLVAAVSSAWADVVSLLEQENLLKSLT